MDKRVATPIDNSLERVLKLVDLPVVKALHSRIETGAITSFFKFMASDMVDTPRLGFLLLIVQRGNCM